MQLRISTLPDRFQAIRVGTVGTVGWVRMTFLENPCSRARPRTESLGTQPTVPTVPIILDDAGQDLIAQMWRKMPPHACLIGICLAQSLRAIYALSTRYLRAIYALSTRYLRASPRSQ
jgi:hypothetical protein